MKKIVKYEIFSTSKEFEKFQEKNDIIIHNIIAVPINFWLSTEKDSNYEESKGYYTVQILVTYTFNDIGS